MDFSQEKKSLIVKLLGIFSVEVNLLNTLHYCLQLLTGYRSKAISEKRVHQDGED